MCVNVVLGIDGVLACHRAENIRQAAFFKNKGAIVTAIKTHYLFPGVLEFFRRLLEIEGVRVTLFSAGDKERNRIFAEEILKLALPEENFESIKHRLQVLSQEDLREPIAHQREEQMNHFEFLPFGANKKDLSLVLREGDLLENAVLIGSDWSYMAYDQVPNFLYMPATSDGDYSSLPHEADEYSPEGYKPMPTVFVSTVLEEGAEGDDCVVLSVNKEDKISREEEGAKEGEGLLVLKLDDEYCIGFLDDESSTYKKIALSPTDHAELIGKLKSYHERLQAQHKVTCVIEDKALCKEIADLVTSLHGRGQTLCRTANRICYVAGMFFSALNESKAKRCSISECLLQRQWVKNGDKYQDRFKCVDDDRFYRLGLEELRKANPTLEFATPQGYRDFCRLPIPPEDQPILKAAMKNEERNACSIM